MRGRRVLGGTGIGTIERHVAGASTLIPHHRLTAMHYHTTPQLRYHTTDWLPHHAPSYHTTVAAAIGLTDHMFAII